MKTKLQLLLVTLGLAALSATAQVPGIISHQGKVTVNGTNYTGSGLFKFALVDATGTHTYWSNDGSSSGGVEPTSAVTLSTARGVFSVNLGDTNVANMTQAIPAAAFTNSAVYLRTWFNDGVDGSQLLTPDRQITSVGYALVAANFTGTLSLAQLPTGVVTNNGTDVALSGSFSGDGSGLTGLDLAQLTGMISLDQLPAGVLTNGSGASGSDSIALGYNTTASGDYSTAMGFNTTASGKYSTALGYYTTASGYFSTATGFGTTASGLASTALGNYARATNDYSFVWADGQDGAGTFPSTTNNQFSVRASGGVRFVTGDAALTVDGNVGIGTTTPAYTLHVNGSVAGGAYHTLSDARLKQDVQPIGDALAIVKALRGVTYNWNQAVDPSLKLDDRNHVGFLAQEVEKVLPQAVSTANDARQTKSVAYSEVIPVLNEAIKQQQTQIETLQAGNDELKARLDALEAKLGQ